MNINADWERLKEKLACHHSIFYKIVEMGKPYLTDKIPTAAVQFDKEGKFISFLFNEKFWKECDDYKKMFVICHEALHVVLKHGTRFVQNDNKDIANMAMDIVVNHSLVRDFGFIRSDIDANNEYCWVDTVFKDKKYLGFPYPDDESTEFYYNEIEKQGKCNNKNEGGCNKEGSNGGNGNGLVDSHDGISDEDLQEIVNKAVDNLDEDEKNHLKDSISKIKNAGTETGDWFNINPVKVSSKRKWETIIKKWEMKSRRLTQIEKEQWIKKARRMSSFNNGLILPSNSEVECLHSVNNKTNVFFFLDTSGSCIHLAERFFTAANSLPKEKFEIKLFCFDTSVKEVDIKSQKVYGGGGTSFNIIEREIQKIKLETKKYPSSVFIITDGYGDRVKPEFPNRWHWFLSDDYLKYIPNGSHRYMLSDFE